MKQFIYEYTDNIKGLTPLAIVKNEYGKEIYFFYISSLGELRTLKNYFISNNTEYKNVLLKSKNQAKEFLKWLINRWTIAIINHPYRINAFLIKNDYQKLNTFTNIEVI